MSEPFHGVLPALITPFTDDGGAIDTDALRRSSSVSSRAGVGGLVPGRQHRRVHDAQPRRTPRARRATVEAAAGRVPVVAGTGALSTRETVELSIHAERAGAAAVMIVPPFYDALVWRELLAHYTAVADGSRSRSCTTTCRARPASRSARSSCARLPITSLKDTGGDAVAATELIQTGGPTLLNGWDTLTFAALAAGVQAVVWGAASIVPEQCVELHRLLIDDIDLPAARELWAGCGRSAASSRARATRPRSRPAARLAGDVTGPVRAPLLALDEASTRELTALVDQARLAEVAR